MKRMSRTYIIFLLAAGMVLGACKKGFLSTLPSSSIVEPTTLANFQSILDNTTVMGRTPVLGELSADNFYLPYSAWQALDPREYNAYVWATDIYQGQGQVEDWDAPYTQVYYANTVLEQLPTVPIVTENAQQWAEEQGSALFLRAYAFYNIAQLFAPAYDTNSAASDLGIPLRLHSDVKAPSVRASVAATYTQILSDLRQASALLSPEISLSYRNRPSKPAALAMLARVYLSMRDYTHAGLYADSALQLYDSLIDYNTVSAAGVRPFTKLNAETIYQSNFLSYTQCLEANTYPNCIVDSLLYQSYAANDLRRILFYTINANGHPNIKFGYSGLAFPFSGLATDECFLIRAECAARAGNTTAALNDLNTLLKNRWKTGSFVPVTAASPAEALDIILAERRKELAFRGIRWSDLRRLNKGGKNITLQRVLNGITSTLPPNSPLYTLPIPPDVLNDNPGMQQNQR
ncbi:MAG TPA: RagB/SusD family nutrient uptake outer membrane protein [Puia sp.]|nr:RagB/SusD family nutrient uptake outer membrane protein [Puia sp.]